MTELGMHVWRLTPVAPPNDPAWQDRQIWLELEVVAESAGRAVFFAAAYDKRHTGHTDETSQDHQQSRSGFEDERLYRVDRIATAVPARASAGFILKAQGQI